MSKFAMVVLLLFTMIPPKRAVMTGEGWDHVASVILAAFLGAKLYQGSR